MNTDAQRLDYLDGICRPLEQGGARVLFVAVGYVPEEGVPPPTNIREAVDLMLANKVEAQDLGGELKLDLDRTAVPKSGLTGVDTAAVIGLVTALAAITAATPQLIINSLKGVLFDEREAGDLRAAAKTQDWMFERIVQDAVQGKAGPK